MLTYYGGKTTASARALVLYVSSETHQEVNRSLNASLPTPTSAVYEDGYYWQTQANRTTEQILSTSKLAFQFPASYELRILVIKLHGSELETTNHSTIRGCQSSVQRLYLTTNVVPEQGGIEHVRGFTQIYLKMSILGLGH